MLRCPDQGYVDYDGIGTFNPPPLLNKRAPLHWGTLDPDLMYSFVIRLILWVVDFHLAVNQGQEGP